MNAGSDTPPSRAYRRALALGLGAAVALPLVVYVLTLSPGFNVEDAAEFALGGLTLGVNHPSGYPLETLIAHLATYVPAGDAARRLNLSAALAGAAATGFVFLLAWTLLNANGLPPGARAAAAWSSAGLFAFSRTFWSQATIPEVYALNAAAVAATLWLAARAWDAPRPAWLYAAAFVAGLAAANHPTSAVVTAPALLAVILRRRHGAELPGVILLLLLGLSVYLYLPLRASREPLLNWGTPADARRFWEHVGRREFGTIYWPRYRYLGDHARELGRLILVDFGPGVGALALVGAVLGWRRSAFAKVLAGLLVVTGPGMLFPLVGLLTPPQLFELNVWFIVFFLLLAVAAAGFGGAALRRATGRRWGRVAVAATLLLPVYPLAFNLRADDRRAFSYGSEDGRNQLRTYPHRALVAIPFYARVGAFEASLPRAAYGRRPDVAFADSRNIIRSGVPATRAAPVFIRSPGDAEEWWGEFIRGILAGGDNRPVFFNNDEPLPAGAGAVLEPFGLAYYARPAAVGRTPWAPPWDRYERAGLARVGADLRPGGVALEPAVYRKWAAFYAAAANDDFRRGERRRGLAALAEARRAAPFDAISSGFVAQAYTVNGDAGAALPLYETALAGLEPMRHDALMFRREYASLLNATAACYLRTGRPDRARSLLRTSFDVWPDQPGVAAFANGQ